MKVLVLGGYGVFGGRLIELLADLDGLTIVVGGRSLAKARSFCQAQTSKCTLVPAAVDRAQTATALEAHKPNLVVDASGPFQDYAGDPYTVVRASIDAGVNYLDFADGSDFVFGVSAFDAAARDAGVFALSGVSSFPVLTAAVLRHFSSDMEILKVTAGIAPSPYAGVGLNVMRAVVGYAGSPVRLMRNGKPASGTGLAESMRYTVAVPGRLPLRNLHYSLVDVPDLQVLPHEYPAITDIWIGAGPVPEILHRILNVLAKLRAALKLPSMTPLAPLFYWVLNKMQFGEHRGGMFVDVTGTKNGEPATKSWHLLAEGDDGPYIPSMAVEALVRRLMSGGKVPPGARPATGALELSDYDRLFARRQIYTGIRSSEDDTGTLYQRVLGRAFSEMPETLQALHRSGPDTIWRGEATVKRKRGLVALVVAKLLGLPNEAESTPVEVRFRPHGNGERWQRRFAESILASDQQLGRGRDTHLITERFGIITVSLALVVQDQQLHFVPRRLKVLHIPMPRFLTPTGTAFEHECDGIFHFDVVYRAPLLGFIAAYRGWLKPEPAEPVGEDGGAST